MLSMLKKPAVAILLLVAVMASSRAIGQSVQTSARGNSVDELVPIQQNGLWGYADQSGKIIIKAQFTRADHFSEGLALVWTGGVHLTDPVLKSFVKMGYIDKTGRWVIHSRFKYYFFYDFSDGLAPFREQSSKWGYMDTTGKVTIRPRFDWAGSFLDNAAPVVLDGKCAHVDKTGKVLDQSETMLPSGKAEEDRHGTYLFKPHLPPCS